MVIVFNLLKPLKEISDLLEKEDTFINIKMHHNSNTIVKKNTLVSIILKIKNKLLKFTKIISKIGLNFTEKKEDFHSL
jgi:hypothetical protein